MKNSYKNIVINSSLLFVITNIAEMTIHEFGHFFASLLVHAKQISIHHNYTSNIDEGLSLTNSLFIKASGPVISLIIGILFHFICSRQFKRNILFLFNLYMSVFGYIGFFGYLIIAPVFPGGDTGYVCYALGFPMWLMIMVAVTGVIALYVLINRLMKYFVELGTKEIIENKEARNKFIRSLILYPLLIGIVITTLLNLPIPAFVSLVAPVCSPFTFMWAYGNALKKHYPVEHANRDFENFNKPHPWVYAFFVLVIIANRFLVWGIYEN
jgi:hypothetical protein